MVFLTGVTMASGGTALPAILAVGSTAASGGGAAATGLAVASGMASTAVASGASAATVAGASAAYGSAAAACVAAGPAGWVALGMTGCQAITATSPQIHVASDIQYADSSVVDALEASGVIKADCWKQVIHESSDVTGCLPFVELMNHPDVLHHEIVNDNVVVLGNRWGETFAAFPVHLPGLPSTVAVHVVPIQPTVCPTQGTYKSANSAIFTSMVDSEVFAMQRTDCAMDLNGCAIGSFVESA